MSTSKKISVTAATVVALVIVGLAFVIWSQVRTSDNGQVNTSNLSTYNGKKVLYIDSYHKGYAWSDGITQGIEDTLANTGVELKIHRMDTKRNAEESFKEGAGRSAKSVVEQFQPDVVITSDDNAFKYLVMPYYRGTDLPFVFNGLNWDASVYGAPYKNTTGMVEVSLTRELIDILKRYSKGEKVGYLSADTETERKNLEYYNKLFGLTFEKEYFVTSMDGWKQAFLALQDEVDVLIFENNAGIQDWNDEEAEAFALEHTKIPVGTLNPWIMQSSLIGMTKVPEEQGIWAAEAALRILGGESPSNIDVVQNKQGKLILNLSIAKVLNASFTPEMVKNAEIVE